MHPVSHASYAGKRHGPARMDSFKLTCCARVFPAFSSRKLEDVMDLFPEDILKKLFPAEKEFVPPAAAARAGPRNPVDHWPTALLLERAAYLRKLARHGNGAESETLKQYPRHSVQLLLRSRDGEAEMHENFADIFFVLEGRATLVTGGTVAGARGAGEGETRGAAVEGGARQQLRAGDVAHVPAGVPHQMLVAGEKTVTCLVVKVQENPEERLDNP